MMKKTVLLLLCAMAAVVASAQNIQAHYDFGRFIYPDEQPDRMKVTLTLEQFKADKWGSWYYFVDVDLSRKAFRSAGTTSPRTSASAQRSRSAYNTYNDKSFFINPTIAAKWNF